MVSFDAKSLIINVSINYLLEYFKQDFRNYNFPIPLSCLLELVKFCVVNPKFTFDGNFFEQKFGIAMRNPIISRP